MAVVLEWMMAVLSNQLRAQAPSFLIGSLAITLTGPGGGTWRVAPDGSVTVGAAQPSAAQITGSYWSLPAAGHGACPPAGAEVTITGDVDHGANTRHPKHR